MKNLKYLKMKILTGTVLLAIITFALITFNKAEKNNPVENKAENPVNFREQPGEFVKKKLSEMTLREKIAQMIVASAIPENFTEGSAEVKKLKKLCTETKVGGFIFFKGSSSDYARLSNILQSNSEVPLLFSSDFERGTKMRVTDGALFPTNMAIGAADNKELCYKMGLEIARETRLLGVHQNYSPVCDVNNNPNNPIINVRSFGEDPLLVSRMSEAMIKGLQDGKVIATAKHFPGHGDTDIDSHNDLPQLNFTMDRMNSIELVPFKNAIEYGVISVMIAHLAFPELESQPNIPASLSPAIVQDLLIDKMNFKGLVVTDALNMKGITKYFSTSEVAVMCVNAGIDLILMPLDEVTTVNAIESAVKSGQISEERINRSAEKILKVKEWLGLFQHKEVQEADVYKSVNTIEANDLAQQIADESITLVKDDDNIMPVKNNTEGKTAFVIISEGGDLDNTDYLKTIAPDYFKGCGFYTATSSSMDSELKGSMNSLSGYDNIIVTIYAKVRFGTGKISISSANIDLVNRLKAAGKNLTVISLGNPYLLKEFPSIPSYICAYGDSDYAIKAALKAISGVVKFKGKLPVSITDDHKYGTSILK
jgi:beta-N-acetylhexosaminidase